MPGSLQAPAAVCCKGEPLGGLPKPSAHAGSREDGQTADNLIRFVRFSTQVALLRSRSGLEPLKKDHGIGLPGSGSRQCSTKQRFQFDDGSSTFFTSIIPFVSRQKISCQEHVQSASAVMVILLACFMFMLGGPELLVVFLCPYGPRRNEPQCCHAHGFSSILRERRSFGDADGGHRQPGRS